MRIEIGITDVGGPITAEVRCGLVVKHIEFQRDEAFCRELFRVVEQVRRTNGEADTGVVETRP
jgi:hypothetical protein